MKVTINWEQDEHGEYYCELESRLGFRLAKKRDGQFISMTTVDGEMISRATSGERRAELQFEVLSIASVNGEEFVLIPEYAIEAKMPDASPAVTRTHYVIGTSKFRPVEDVIQVMIQRGRSELQARGIMHGVVGAGNIRIARVTDGKVFELSSAQAVAELLEDGVVTNVDVGGEPITH